jgi:SAM-dependent methyltransferase
MKDSVLNKITHNDLAEFLMMCSKHVKLDVISTFNLIQGMVKDFNGQSVPRAELKAIEDLEARWYKSLEKGQPDYSVYADPLYYCDLWLCWLKYSRSYLTLMNKDTTVKKYNRSIVEDSKEQVKTVFDLGCGVGYTTAVLKSFYPKAKVYGTNLKGTPQWDMATTMGQQHKFTVTDTLKKADLVFASEYFEHIEEPLDHLAYILLKCKPKYLVIANSFSADAIGHFRTYKNKNKPTTIYHKAMARHFNILLKSAGYYQEDIKNWNSRPSYWKLNNLTSH